MPHHSKLLPQSLQKSLEQPLLQTLSQSLPLNQYLQKKTILEHQNPQSVESYHTKLVDQCLDNLTVGWETMIQKKHDNSLNLINTLQQELETGNLPAEL